MKRTIRQARLALLWVLVSGCAGESAPSPFTVMRSDSAGVEIVVSSGADRPLDWRLERRLTLGGAAEGPEAFGAISARTVGTDAAGRIYILDTGGRRVIVFTPDGEHIRTVGGEGQGPGETAFPASIAVTPDGVVSVFDFGKGGLVRFGPEGEILPEMSFRFFPWPISNRRHIAATADAMVVATRLPPIEEGTFRHAIQRVTSQDTTVIAQRIFPRPGMVRYPDRFAAREADELDISRLVVYEVVR